MKPANVIFREMVLLAAPLIFGNILQQLYNAADSIIIGRFLGGYAFAATGVSGSLMNLFIFVLSGCCTGVSIILAQQYGGKEYAEYRQEFFVAVIAGLGFTIVLSIVGTMFLGPILQLMHTPDELLEYSAEYLRIILLGIPVTFLYNLFAAVLRSIGNTRAALFFLILAVVCNIALDYLFIVLFHLGVAGAAWATIIAQLLSAILSLFYVRGTISHLLFTRTDMRINRRLLQKTAYFGLVSALQQSSLYVGKLLVMGMVNNLGTASIAAYTATMRIEGFVNTLGEGGSVASSVLIAQNYGTGNWENIRRTYGVSICTHLVAGSIFSFLLYLSADPASRLFLGDTGETIIQLCAAYLKCISFFYVLNFIGCAFNGYFRGVGRVSIPTIGSTIHISLRVLLTYYLASRFDIIAVAIATGIGWVSVVIFDCLCYFRTSRMQDAVG